MNSEEINHIECNDKNTALRKKFLISKLECDKM